MNKEAAIDYTSEEFWATAPKDATHFYPEDHEFHASFWEFSKSMQAIQCWVIYPDKTIEHYKNPSFSQRMGSGIPRPTTFTKPTQESFVGKGDWFVDGKCVEFPPVGEVVEILWDSETECFPASYEKVRIVAIDGDDIIYRCFVNDSIGNLSKAVLHSDEHPMFRPIKKEPTIQEKILEAWKEQGIDFAYDNEDTNFSFKVLVDFVVNNFDVKEK